MKSKLFVLGSGSLVPDHRRYPASYLIQTPEKRILIDIGPGILRQLSKMGLQYHELTDIFITHMHPDHILDLLTLFFASNYDPEKQSFRINIYLHHTCREFLEAAIKPWQDWLQPSEIHFRWHFLSNQGRDLYFQWEKVPHHQSSLAYSFCINQKKILFTGDTAAFDYQSDFWQSPDYLIIEAAKKDDKDGTKHLTIKQAVEIGKAIDAKQLLITHIYPKLEKSITQFLKNKQSDNVRIVSDLMEFDL
ncbi:MAG TPA: ribonuclease Z [Candidatus Marinimicrobia bacterium]|nr:ribonuclease Z [Candidatus Neomarinimicrobiota bacterium]